MTGGSCAVRSPIGCAIREPLRQLQLLHLQRVSNGLLVKNNVLSGKNARANASLKRWPMAARAIRNKVVHRARDLSFAAKDNSERLQPVALPRAAVRADIRLHAEAVMPINNSSSSHRVSINRRRANAPSKVRRVAMRVVRPAADAGSRVAKGARVRVARHKAALAGLQVVRKHRSANHLPISASSDWIVADSVVIRASDV